jgi:glycosyltransferase involved in cell wall biosynthesis
VRVCVLTTSYPRFSGDVAGTFVAEAVGHLRAAGVEVTVVSPADFPHFGIAFGDGITQNLRRRPWLLPVLPVFLALFARAARRAARDADVVHAHWIPSAVAALATRKPFVLQVWGTDVELARHHPWLVRPLIRRARVVIAGSAYLARRARSLGARDARIIPNGVDIPDHVGSPAAPAHVLFVGRLSEEKGILEFLDATDGLPRVIVGDGPLRARVPEAVGFVVPRAVGGYYERAVVVCVPSRREGYGMVAREAMAHGRPVVATRVGGLVDAIVDGESGLLVERGVSELKEAVSGLLSDPARCEAMGRAARERAQRELSWPRAVEALMQVYRRVVADADGAPAGRQP